MKIANYVPTLANFSRSLISVDFQGSFEGARPCSHTTVCAEQAVPKGQHFLRHFYYAEGLISPHITRSDSCSCIHFTWGATSIFFKKPERVLTVLSPNTVHHEKSQRIMRSSFPGRTFICEDFDTVLQCRRRWTDSSLVFVPEAVHYRHIILAYLFLLYNPPDAMTICSTRWRRRLREMEECEGVSHAKGNAHISFQLSRRKQRCTAWNMTKSNISICM